MGGIEGRDSEAEFTSEPPRDQSVDSVSVRGYAPVAISISGSFESTAALDSNSAIGAVTCSNKDKGKDIKKVCTVGCIGCKSCARASDLFTIKDNLSTINYDAYKPVCSRKAMTLPYSRPTETKTVSGQSLAPISEIPSRLF